RCDPQTDIHPYAFKVPRKGNCDDMVESARTGHAGGVMCGRRLDQRQVRTEFGKATQSVQEHTFVHGRRVTRIKDFVGGSRDEPCCTERQIYCSDFLRYKFVSSFETKTLISKVVRPIELNRFLIDCGAVTVRTHQGRINPARKVVPVVKRSDRNVGSAV